MRRCSHGGVLLGSNVRAIWVAGTPMWANAARWGAWAIRRGPVFGRDAAKNVRRHSQVRGFSGVG